MPNIKKPKSAAVTETHKQAFDEIVSIIRNARKKTFQTVNTVLIDLYWQVGEYISRKVQSAAWGEGVIDVSEILQLGEIKRIFEAWFFCPTNGILEC